MIDVDWLRENAPDMTAAEMAKELDSKPRYINDLLRKYRIECLRTTPTSLPPEGITREWLIQNRRINTRSLAVHARVKESTVMKAYWELCRVPGTPVPVQIGYGGCDKCAFRELCTAGRCMCESIQLWENDPMRPKRLADTA